MRVGPAGLVTLLLVSIVVGGCSPPRLSTTAETPPVLISPESTSVAQQALESETKPEDAGRLIVSRSASAPIVDGAVDDIWSRQVAEPLLISWRKGSPEIAQGMSVQALLVDETVYFLAQWEGPPPQAEDQTTSNRFTLHMRIPEDVAESKRLNCNVVCHTAFSDPEGRFAYANAETIPAGGDEDLPVAGGWQAGVWTVEWSRPLVSDNPFDLQFSDLDRAYLFFVKVFGSGSDVVDPVSAKYQLEFAPQ